MKLDTFLFHPTEFPLVNEFLNRDEGIEVIRTIVAECLARDILEVRGESRLITELGADSLDFIDLIFTLEKRFGLRLGENDLSMLGRPTIAGQDAGATAEFLPADTVSRLLPWLPELASLPDPAHVRPTEVLPLITVEALWRLVEQNSTKQGGRDA